MLKKGYLASNVFYACTEHKDEYIDEYLNILDILFGNIKEFEDGKDVNNFLDGPLSHTGFKRLN